VDVGIKNLGICVLETTNTLPMYTIQHWERINLCNNDVKQCNYISNNIKCTKNAKYEKNDMLYCKCHAQKTEYKIPPPSLIKYKRMTVNELLCIIDEYDISYSKVNNKIPAKNILSNIIEIFLKDKVWDCIGINKCKDFSLIDVGIIIKEKLDCLDLTNIDTILIENQISPIATRMNSIQGMITQYFIMKNIHNIQYISAINKLKPFIEKKTTYNERKKLCIDITLNILEINRNENNIKWLDIFKQSKKQDDMADSLLQGLWYLDSINKISIKEII
jgi:hypothetical protein